VVCEEELKFRIKFGLILVYKMLIKTEDRLQVGPFH